jgi:hypothetical protein
LNSRNNDFVGRSHHPRLGMAEELFFPLFFWCSELDDFYEDNDHMTTSTEANKFGTWTDVNCLFRVMYEFFTHIIKVVQTLRLHSFFCSCTNSTWFIVSFISNV